MGIGTAVVAFAVTATIITTIITAQATAATDADIAITIINIADCRLHYP